MSRVRTGPAVLLLLLAAVAHRPAQAWPVRPDGEIVVSAAVSLSEALVAIAELFERSRGVHVLLNLGPSSTLARQIREGAGVDVFISADEAQMDSVRRAGKVRREDIVPLLGNRLVIVESADRPAGISHPKDLLEPRVRRVALADPAAVPAGVYARRYLESLGLWDALASKLVPTDGVRAALAAVENRLADAAFVYKTDAAVAKRARVAFEVPRDGTPAIVYPAAVTVRGAGNPAAREFAAFLKGEAATAVFRLAGFQVLPREAR